MDRPAKRYAFVCGCPRSGTTFLAAALNSHPKIAIGIERYGNMFFRQDLSPSLFTKERFFKIERGDTFYETLDFSKIYEEKEQTYDDALVIGDKIPMLFRYFEGLKRSFSQSKVIFCIRNIIDVASSYQKRANDSSDLSWKREKDAIAAIKDWNESIENYITFRESMDIFLFDYDECMLNPNATLRSVFDFLGLDWDEHLEASLVPLIKRSDQLEELRRRDLTSHIVKAILLHASISDYANIIRGRVPC